MTIGVLGGTFNPIHIGHLILAQEVGMALSFSKILFVPARIPPLKPYAISETHRFAMVQLAIQGNPFFQISRVEIDRQEVSYTIDTVRLLQTQEKEAIAFIIGSDNILDLPRWHQWRTLLEICDIVIGERPGFGYEAIKQLEPLVGKKNCARWCQNLIPLPAVHISSSEIRKRYTQGKSNKYLVPELVDQYILQQKLYV